MSDMVQSQTSPRSSDRSVQEMALTNYVIARHIISHLSYLDAVNVLKASEDIMKMAGSKVSYLVIWMPLQRISSNLLWGPGCSCDTFWANVEECTIAGTKIYKIRLQNLLNNLIELRRTSFKLSLRIMIPSLTTKYLQEHRHQVVPFLIELGFHVEEFECKLNNEREHEQCFEFVQYCLPLFRNLRVLRFTAGYQNVEIPMILPEIPFSLFNLTTVYFHSCRKCKPTIDFLLSIAPNLEAIFGFPPDSFDLLVKYKVEAVVKSIARFDYRNKNYAEYFGKLANEGVQLESAQVPTLEDLEAPYSRVLQSSKLSVKELLIQNCRESDECNHIDFEMPAVKSLSFDLDLICKKHDHYFPKGTNLKSLFPNFEAICISTTTNGHNAFPEEIFGPQALGNTVKRIEINTRWFLEDPGSVFPYVNHVIVGSIDMKNVTTTLHKMNYKWPHLSSATFCIVEGLVSDGGCYCNYPGIDSVITGISDETLKSINNRDSDDKIEIECPGTSVLYEMKNLRSLKFIVPFCHLFFSEGQKGNVTIASVNTLRKLPNLKVSLIVNIFNQYHICWDVHKLYADFKQEFQPFSDHIHVDTFSTEEFYRHLNILNCVRGSMF